MRKYFGWSLLNFNYFNYQERTCGIPFTIYIELAECISSKLLKRILHFSSDCHHHSVPKKRKTPSSFYVL